MPSIRRYKSNQSQLCTTEAVRSVPSNSLWPHSARVFARLGLPITTVLLLGTPTYATWLLCLAGLFLLFTWEPLLVALKIKGRRTSASSDSTSRAQALTFITLALSCLSAGFAYIKSPAHIQVAILIPYGCVLIAVLIFRDRHDDWFLAHALGAFAMLVFSVPVALSAGLDLSLVLEITLFWATIFMVNFSARRLATNRRLESGAVYAGLLLITMTGASIASLRHATLHVAAPALALAWGMVAFGVRRKHIRWLDYTTMLVVGLVAVQFINLLRAEQAKRITGSEPSIVATSR